MFEAEHSERTATPASAVWARWVRPQRWPEWDKRVASAEAEAELAEGVEIRVKLRKGGTTRQQVVEIEPGTRLVTEFALPGARVGHEHVVEQRGSGCEVSHRLYVDGPMSGIWSLMLGRRKLRETVSAFTDTR